MYVILYIIKWYSLPLICQQGLAKGKWKTDQHHGKSGIVPNHICSSANLWLQWVVQRIGLLQEVDYSIYLYTQPSVISQASKYYSDQCIYYIFLQLTMGQLSTFGQRSLESGPTGPWFTWLTLNILCDHHLVVNNSLWPLWHRFRWFRPLHLFKFRIRMLCHATWIFRFNKVSYS